MRLLRYREDVLGLGGRFRRRHRAVVLGPVSELSLRQARRLAEQILRPINAGCWRPQSLVTLRDFYSQQYAQDVLPNLKRSTQSSYRANLNQHILPALGDLRLLELSRSDVQRFVTALAGKGLERQTTKNVWTTLSAVLTTAVEYGNLERNPARGIKLGAREPRKTHFIPSPGEFADLAARLGEPARTIALLLAGTGMRIGEAMALRIEDVDLENLTIRVSQDVWHGHLDTPKSDASVATLPIGPKLASVLEGHLACLGRSTGFLFANEQGQPLDPIYLARKFLYPAQQSLSLPRFSWHTFRHLHATRLGAHNVPVRIVQAQLRHRDPALTLGVYTHVIEESRRRAVEEVENDLFSIVLTAEEAREAQTPVEATK
jgi:integrase